jgi:hypothetical protein
LSLLGVKPRKQSQKFLKTFPAIGPNTPVIPPSTYTVAPQQTPTDPHPSTENKLQRKSFLSAAGTRTGAAPETTGLPLRRPRKEEEEVTSADKAEALADDAIVFPANIGYSFDIHATPKAYATKFFHKLTGAEKWELEQDLLNSMLENACRKSDAQSYEIEKYKKKTCEFLDNLLCKRKVSHSPSSPRVSRKKPNLLCTLIL